MSGSQCDISLKTQRAYEIKDTMCYKDLYVKSYA